MKTITKLIVILLLSFTYQAGAQEKNNVVKAGAHMTGGWGILTASYERMLSGKLSLQLTLGYGGFTHETNLRYVVNGSPRESWKHRHYLLLPELRYYLRSSVKPAPGGFYGAIFPFHFRRITKYNDGKTGEENYTRTVSDYGAGIKLGHQWLIRNLISADFNIGAGYLSKYEKFDDESTRHWTDRPFFNWQFCLGVAF